MPWEEDNVFFSTYILLCLIQITHTGSYIITLSFIIYIISYHLLPLVPLVSDFNWCNDSWLICMDLCDFVTCTAKTCCTHHITAIKNWNHNTHNKPLRMTSSPSSTTWSHKSWHVWLYDRLLRHIVNKTLSLTNLSIRILTKQSF